MVQFLGENGPLDSIETWSISTKCVDLTRHKNQLNIIIYFRQHCISYSRQNCAKNGAASNGVIELSLSRDTWSYTYIIYIYMSDRWLFLQTLVQFMLSWTSEALEGSCQLVYMILQVRDVIQVLVLVDLYPSNVLTGVQSSSLNIFYFSTIMTFVSSD